MDSGAGQSRRPANTPFRQQTLKAWRPILTPLWVISTFTMVGVVFIPIGFVCLDASDQLIEVKSAPYDEACCKKNCGVDDEDRIDFNPCRISVKIPARMEPPIHMYYMLENFYQNHRRYVKSRSDRQLRGETGLTAADSALADCAPRAKFDPDGDDSIGNTINPCGLIAWSFFNDTFKLYKPDGAKVHLRKRGIAWPSDVADKFNNSHETGDNFPPFAGMDCRRGSGECVEDEDFIVWMRTAGLPTFRKLYRRIDQALPAGTYELEISNGWEEDDRDGLVNKWTNESQRFLYPVHTFSGHKYVVLTTTSWIGGKNPFLGWAYIIVGAVSLALALAFFVKHKVSPRRLGDTSYLIWSKDGSSAHHQ